MLQYWYFSLSIQHTVVVDKRDNMVFPTEGYFLKLAQVCLLFLSVVKKVFTEMETLTKHPRDYLEEVMVQFWPSLCHATLRNVAWRREGNWTKLTAVKDDNLARQAQAELSHLKIVTVILSNSFHIRFWQILTFDIFWGPQVYYMVQGFCSSKTQNGSISYRISSYKFLVQIVNNYWMRFLWYPE